MKIIGFLFMLSWIPFWPKVDVYDHENSKWYQKAEFEERQQRHQSMATPVIWVWGIYRHRTVNKYLKKQGIEIPSFYFDFNYYCPQEYLVLKEVRVKFEGFEVLVLSHDDFEVRKGDKLYDRKYSHLEGSVFFYLRGAMSARYAKSDLEFVQFISAKDSPCQINIKIEGFKMRTDPIVNA